MTKIIFEHNKPREIEDLVTCSVNGKRRYITPHGQYPSITTILGAFPKPGLQAWRKRVGDAEANRISRTATTRGTKIHSLCEQYLLNNEIDKNHYMPDVLSSFYEFRKLLNRINNIHYLEAALFSKQLKVAGRCDCVGHFDDELAIIDFKTSRKFKKEEYIEDYFIQCAFYAMAYHEMFSIQAKKIVVLIAVDEDENQVFVRNTRDYVPCAIKKIKDYYKHYHE